MHLNIAIAHAAFLPERAVTLERLLAKLPNDPTVRVFHSARREHASVWARRLWAWAAENADAYTVCLNDDVLVPDGFADIIRAMVASVPTEVISLHTTAPVATSLLNAGERWLRSYWLTGPGYVLPPGAARSMLAFSDMHTSLTAAVNEDNLAMHWAWHMQRPMWHAMPAVVVHDASVPSSLGYDDHPGRVTTVPWGEWDASLTSSAAWDTIGTPPLVECPWMPRAQLAAVERALYRNGGAVCGMCFEGRPQVGINGGLMLCGGCVVRMVEALSKGVG